MAHYARDTHGLNASRTVKIIAFEQLENHTVYIIELNIGHYKWTVRHRYNEFYELHEKLVLQYKLDKTLLPPKKIFGNQSETFINKRQVELEVYLQTVLHHLPDVPLYLAEFLQFDQYEVHGLTQVLAEELFNHGDEILEAKETYNVSPIQLHAITRRLRLAEPTCGSQCITDSGDKKKDIGHILDFITRLKFLRIHGGSERFGSSNIIPNQLNFDLSNFKALETLELLNVNCDMILESDHLKQRLHKLRIHRSIKSIQDVLLVGIGHGEWLGGADETIIVPAWTHLESANFSHNALPVIDEAVKLMPNVERLDLSNNKLTDIQQLQYLSSLKHLNISRNEIQTLNSLHTKLGNIQSLNLAINCIESLQGFSKLYSLERLDLSDNTVSQVLEVRHICKLPCLERLILARNPVTMVVDYRTKILELFADRAKEILLDGERASQQELDTVAILLAIQKSKETKERAKKHIAKRRANNTASSSSTERRVNTLLEVSHTRKKHQNSGSFVSGS